MKEYHEENGRTVDISKLKAPFMPEKDYIQANKGLVTICHDIILEYNGGALLVTRDNYPAKGLLFPIGGRVKRGMKTEESLRMKVKGESNLEVTGITFLGCARTFYKTDPFGHKKGTDDISLMFFGKAKGTLKLDNLHKDPVIVTKEKFRKLRARLHPYVRDFLDDVFARALLE